MTGTGIGVSLRSSSSPLSVSLNRRFSSPFKLTGSVLGGFYSPGSGSLEDLRLLRRADCLAAASTNSLDGGLKSDFLRTLGAFSSLLSFTLLAFNLLLLSFCLSIGFSFFNGFSCVIFCITRFFFLFKFFVSCLKTNVE